MDFYSAYAHGFARVAACTLPVALADPAQNAHRVIEQARACDAEGVAVAVFPELCLTGYAVDDLFLQDTLLEAVLAAIDEVVVASRDLLPVIVVGAPLREGNRLLNAAVVIHRGRVLGVAAKSYLPTYREFYERRWFAPADDRRGARTTLAGQDVALGPDLLFAATDVPGLVLHVEVCEDLWVPVPPSAEAALGGATVLANLSGSPITVARAEDRRLLVRSASQRCAAAYVFAAAGQGESTTDLSWDGQTMIYEAGDLLAESERFPEGPRRSVADVDLDRLRQERLRQGTFDDNRRTHDARVSTLRTIAFELRAPGGDLGLRRRVARFPFVPDDPARLAQDCYEAYSIQVSGLEQRLRAIGQPKVVVGVSGGLDSTHALIVAARAMDRLGRPRTDVHAVTMPGFATGEASKAYALRLATSLGVHVEELDITPAARQMLADLDHPFSDGEPVYDVTFENVQAGLRTDYLFRIANHRGGIVLGTGDLSELALGWCTYGVGDQMSHYNVNAGVPKTLIQHLIRWVAGSGTFSEETDAVLREIVVQEITPELVPHAEGERPQATEDAVGPYSLQDFTLYHVLRRGYRPSKIAFLAWHAWRDQGAGRWPPGFPEERRTDHDLAAVRHWLEVFTRRFFASQFKRSALPNGPKVSSGGTMSPRGDWRMPSDVAPAAWLAEIEANIPTGATIGETGGEPTDDAGGDPVGEQGPRVLVVQHEDDAPAAWFGRWLLEAGAQLDVRRPYAGDELPEDLAEHDALLVLGGEMGATDDHVAWIAPTRALVREAARSARPTLGICLGHQLCAVALGGSVGRNPRGQQLGLLTVGWLPEAAEDPLLGAVVDTAHAVHWNDDVVTDLPEGARVLAWAPGGEIQAARLAATVWGVQLHPEVDHEVVAAWAPATRAVHGDPVVDEALARVEAARDELHAGWRPLADALVALARTAASTRPAVP